MARTYGAPNANNNNSGARANNNSNAKLIGASIAGIAILAVLGVVGYFIFGNKSVSNEQPSTEVLETVPDGNTAEVSISDETIDVMTGEDAIVTFVMTDERKNNDDIIIYEYLRNALVYDFLNDNYNQIRNAYTDELGENSMFVQAVFPDYATLCSLLESNGENLYSSGVMTPMESIVLGYDDSGVVTYELLFHQLIQFHDEDKGYTYKTPSYVITYNISSEGNIVSIDSAYRLGTNYSEYYDSENDNTKKANAIFVDFINDVFTFYSDDEYVNHRRHYVDMLGESDNFMTTIYVEHSKESHQIETSGECWGVVVSCVSSETEVPNKFRCELVIYIDVNVGQMYEQVITLEYVITDSNDVTDIELIDRKY